MPKCESCGRFMACERGASWRMVYSGYPPTPDREEYRCKRCTKKYGKPDPQHGIKPEASCGIFN